MDEAKKIKEKVSTFYKNDSIQDFLSVGLVSINQDGQILQTNQFMTRWLKYASNELEGKNIIELVDKKSRSMLLEIITDAQNFVDSAIKIDLIDNYSQIKKCALKVIKICNESGFVLFEIVSVEQITSLESELLDTKEFLQLVTDHNKDLIFVKDAQFRIVFANKAFLSIYPKSIRNQVVGKTTLEEYLPEEAEKFLVQDKLAFSNGKSKVLETISFPNGEKRILETRKKRYADSRHNAFILGVSRDVTESKQLVEALEKSNEDLNQFAYVASHDLKSPANAINQIVGWIEEDCLDDLPQVAINHLALLKNRSKRMITLLDDLLEYSRFNHGKYNVRHISMPIMVDHILELKNPNNRFKITVDRVSFSAPYTPMEIILRNLIFNAIKHHDKGHGKIQVNLFKHDTHDELVVSDDGPGIPQGLHQKAIEMFQTLKPRDQVEGSGMGLAMVKKIVTMYSGDIVLCEASSDKKTSGLAVIIKWPKGSFIDWRDG